MAMMFIAGGVIGGLMAAMVVYAYLKGAYKKETAEAYDRGYKDGREIEQRAILDYIDLLNKDANACIYNDELSRGSEK